MRHRRQSSQLLRVEMLESRTLLAGTGFETALAEVAPAISGQGVFTFGFSERIGDTALFVTGSTASMLTINFDLLPASITSVSVASFNTVTFTGRDQLSKLVVTDVKTFDADNIELTAEARAYATNVGTISLASGGFLFVLDGSSTKLDIADLDSTLIISNLESLSISSHTTKLSIVSLNSAQTVKLLYAADTQSVPGTEKQALILPGGEVATVDNGAGSGSGNVVTTPLDEHTSLLLARLREELLVGNSAGVFAVLQSLEDSTQSWGGGSISIGAHLATLATQRELSVTLTDVQSLTQVTAVNQTIPTLGELETSGRLIADPAPDFAAAATLVIGQPMPIHEVDLQSEIAAAIPGNDIDAAFFAPIRRDTAREVFLGAIHEESRALGDIVLAGIAAEIMPGEQTAFLLVDPKPSRANAERNRESSIDLYA